MRRAVSRPAGNLALCGVLSLATALLLLIEVAIIGNKGLFLAAASLTTACALVLVLVVATAAPHPLDARIARTRLTPRPDILSTVLYCAGIIGSVAAYCYLALTRPAFVNAGDAIVFWDVVNKRPFVVAYLIVAAFLAFHWFMVGFFIAPKPSGRAAIGDRTGPMQRVQKLVGAAAVIFLSYWWICLPILQPVSPGDGTTLATFYNIHIQVHQGALEQIRLGAVPYLEAQTQYGFGNQLLLSFLTNSIGISDHAFYLANNLLNVACVIGFFVFLQQSLGAGWAIAALIGWLVFPSPYGALESTGWAILTRWITVPILAVSLARLLLVRTGPAWRECARWLLAGAVWGLGGFLSQENLSGGLLVLGFSIALFGPASGMSLRTVAGLAAIFISAGVVVFAALVACFVGLSNLFDVLHLAGMKSGLVMTGSTNSVWSDDLGVSITLSVVKGFFRPVFEAHGQVWLMLKAYGFAFLLVASIGLLAGFVGRRWMTVDAGQRKFARKFGGVAVGAYALGFFTLLRTDPAHLEGPSFLLPLFLLTLPLFAWRCLASGKARVVLLVLSAGLILDAAIANGSAVARKVAGLGDVWPESLAAWEEYSHLRKLADQPPDLAARYSPLPQHEAVFRHHRDFEETRELFGLLRERLKGRRVELGFYGVNDLIYSPELFYFFGGFRSVSGITSPMNSIWLLSEQTAWIAQVVGTKDACVFFEPDSHSRLRAAWKEATDRPGSATEEPIIGKRTYGILACKS